MLLTGCNNEKLSATPPDQNNKGGTQAVDIPSSTPSSTPANSPNGNTADNKGVVEIKEKMFIAQTNDIYINPEDYLGKTIKYEGIFDPYEYEETGMTYYYVIRYGPGCCGYDANAGFEVIWSGDYPNINDWVEVIGVLEEYEEDGNKYLRLNLSSLTVLDTRGAENVYQ